MRKNYFSNVEQQLSSSRNSLGQGWLHWDNAKVKTCASKLPRGNVYIRLEKLKQDKMRRVMNSTMQSVLTSLGIPPSLLDPMLVLM
jgi:hypothetical protein